MKKPSPTIIVVLLIMSTLSLSFSIQQSTCGESSTTVSIQPSAQTVETGQTFVVNATITNVTDLFAWQVRVSYKSTTLNFSDAWLPSGHVFDGKSFFSSDPHVYVDYVLFSVTLFVGETSFTGSGVLCQMNFTVIGEDDCTLELGPELNEPGHTKLENSTGGFIDFTVEDSSITVKVHNVAISKITTVCKGYETEKTIVCKGYTANFSVTAKNRGDFSETTNVALWVQNISTYQVGATIPVTLNPGASTDIDYFFNTTTWSKGSYTIFANATTVSGEVTLDDNTFIYAPFYIVHVGNVVIDEIVDISDLAAIARSFAQEVGTPRYVANYDINDDGIVDISDLAIAARHYGEPA